jgi:hypothetical protein
LFAQVSLEMFTDIDSVRTEVQCKVRRQVWRKVRCTMWRSG